jgi:hypothetical protein
MFSQHLTQVNVTAYEYVSEHDRLRNLYQYTEITS